MTMDECRELAEEIAGQHSLTIDRWESGKFLVEAPLADIIWNAHVSMPGEARKAVFGIVERELTIHEPDIIRELVEVRVKAAKNHMRGLVPA